MTTGDLVQLTDVQPSVPHYITLAYLKSDPFFCLGFGTPLSFYNMASFLPTVLYDLTPDWLLLLSLTAGGSLSDRRGGGDLITPMVTWLHIIRAK